MDGKTEKIQFVDTTGQEEYSIVRKKALVACRGFVVGFDLTNKNSFVAVTGFLKEIKKATGKKLKNVSLVLVGNKVDLEEKRQGGDPNN